MCSMKHLKLTYNVSVPKGDLRSETYFADVITYLSLNTVLILIRPCATQPKSASFRCFFFLFYFTTCFGLTGHLQVYKVFLMSLLCFPLDVLDASILSRYVQIHIWHIQEHFDVAVSISTGYGLGDWGVGVLVPVGARIFCTWMSFRPVLGPTQSLIQLVPGILSPGGKRPGLKADGSSPTTAEVKKTLIYRATVPHTFTAYCLSIGTIFTTTL
jgi:hypothetical protein